MLNILLILILCRPFISSLGWPSLDTYYAYALIVCSLLLIKTRKSPSATPLSDFRSGICYILSYTTKKDKPPSFPGQGYLLLFFLAIIISAFSSLEPSTSLKALPKFLAYFFIFYAVYYTNNAEKKRIILTLILTAACVSLYAIYWFYLGSLDLLSYMQEEKIIYPFAQELLGRRRAFIPYVLPSLLAGFLILMLPISVGYLIKNPRYLLLVLPIAFALLLTKSIGAFLSFSLSLLLFVVLSRRFNFLYHKKNFLLALALLLALTSILILRSYKTAYFLTPAFSIQNRLLYWQNTLSIIAKHPFRGMGLGNLPFIQAQFAHNSYLQIWAEAGLLGIISFLGFLYKSLKTIQSERLATDKLYAGLAIAQFSFLIHNLIDFSFFLPEVCLFWCIILALFLST